MDGILSPIFLQAASNIKREEPEANVIILHVIEQDYSGVMNIFVSSNSKFTVEYNEVAGDPPVIQEFNEPSYNNEEIQLPQVAGNTDIIIRGDVTILNINTDTIQIETINTLGCNTLTQLYTDYQDVEEFMLNSELTTFAPDSSIRNLKTIYYAAVDEGVCNTLATLIVSSTVDEGTLYTDENGAYYSILEEAANNRGWTIVTSNEQ